MLKRLRAQTRQETVKDIRFAGVCILGGMAVGATWLKPSWFVLAWAGMALLLVAIRGQSSFRASGTGFLFGLSVILTAFWWSPQPIQFSIDCAYPIAVALFACLAIVEAVQFAVFCGLVNWLIGKPSFRTSGLTGAACILVYPLAWVGIEYFWPHVFPWRLGHSQIEFPWATQIADIGGAFAVSFWVVSVAAILSELFVRFARFRKHASASMEFANIPIVQLGLLAAFVIASLGYGAWSLDQYEGRDFEAKLRVGLIQIDPTFSGSHEKLLEATRKIESQVDLVCWPESSVGTYANELKNFRNEDDLFAYSREPSLGLRPMSDPKTYLLATGMSYFQATLQEDESEADGPYQVTAFLIDPEETIVGRYHKRRLIPIGEMVPFGEQFPWLRRMANLDEIVLPGTSPNVLAAGAGARIGAMICYEDILPGSARELSQAGANVLICMINGTAFEQPTALFQHQQLAIFRAIENRRYFIRCASTGITSVVSPTGKVIEQLQPQTEGTIVASVGLLEQKTIYTRFGDWFVGLCWIGLVALGVFRRRPMNRRQRIVPEDHNLAT